MRRIGISVVGGLLLIAAVAGGCGGSGDSATAETLTKAEFIKRADAICKRADAVQNKELRSYFAKRSDGNPSRTLNEEAIVKVGLPPLRDEASELDALPAPEGDEEEIQAIVEGIEEAIEKSEKEPGALVSSNSAGPFTAVGKLASEYGLKVCAFPL